MELEAMGFIHSKGGMMKLFKNIGEMVGGTVDKVITTVYESSPKDVITSSITGVVKTAITTKDLAASVIANVKASKKTAKSNVEKKVEKTSLEEANERLVH